MDGAGSRSGGRRAAVICGAVFLSLLMTVVPARAHSITGFNWTSVDTLCSSSTCVSQGNLVGAWQSILWADGYLNKCGSSGIDGYFGSVTNSATKTWQGAHALSADGVVGPMTWGSARSALVYQGTHPTFGSDGKVVASVQYWDYVGKKHTVHFQYSSPVWAFKAPANGGNLPYYMTSHPGIFFARC